MRTDNAMLGTSGHARVENDFYPTPPECTIGLITQTFPEMGIDILGRLVWEPACGAGHISNVLRDYGAIVIESDIAPQVAGTAEFDFTSANDFTHLAPYTNLHGIGDPEFIITNPPYDRKIIDAFMDRCVMYARDYGVTCFMLMRNEVDSAVTRKRFFRDCPEFSAKIPLLWRPRWIAGSTGSPRHNYSWYCWAPKRNRRHFYVERPAA